MKTILAIVGLAGSGKSEAADFFNNKKLPIIHFGRIINEYIDEHKLLHNEESHKKLTEGLRKKYGKEAMAILNKEKIKKQLENNNLVVIDGLYSWEEYKYLKKKFPKCKIYLLAIFTLKSIRYKRVSQRRYRTNLAGEERDIRELVNLNKGSPIAFADYLVVNDSSKKIFYNRLEKIYKKIIAF